HYRHALVWRPPIEQDDGGGEKDQAEPRVEQEAQEEQPDEHGCCHGLWQGKMSTAPMWPPAHDLGRAGAARLSEIGEFERRITDSSPPERARLARCGSGPVN